MNQELLVTSNHSALSVPVALLKDFFALRKAPKGLFYLQDTSSGCIQPLDVPNNFLYMSSELFAACNQWANTLFSLSYHNLVKLEHKKLTTELKSCIGRIEVYVGGDC